MRRVVLVLFVVLGLLGAPERVGAQEQCTSGSSYHNGYTNFIPTSGLSLTGLTILSENSFRIQSGYELTGSGDFLFVRNFVTVTNAAWYASGDFQARNGARSFTWTLCTRIASTPTPTAEPTAEPTATATATPTPTATEEPTPTATPTATPDPTATTEPPTDTAEPTPTSEPPSHTATTASAPIILPTVMSAPTIEQYLESYSTPLEQFAERPIGMAIVALLLLAIGFWFVTPRR